MERKQDSQTELRLEIRIVERDRSSSSRFGTRKSEGGEGPCSTSLKFADDRVLVYRENEVKLLTRGRNVRAHAL